MQPHSITTPSFITAAEPWMPHDLASSEARVLVDREVLDVRRELDGARGPGAAGNALALREGDRLAALEPGGRAGRGRDVGDELVAIGLPDDSDCAGEGAGARNSLSRCSGEQLG